MKGRLVLLVGSAVAVVAMVLFFRGTSTDGGSGEALAEVTVPQLTNVQMQGETAFKANCATCHGVNAAGKDGFGPPLVHKIYEPSHHGDMAFVLAAKRGVRQHHWPFGNMPPQPHVNDQEIRAIIAYIRPLQRCPAGARFSIALFPQYQFGNPLVRAVFVVVFITVDE